MTDSNSVPCPMCGSENEAGAAFCTICGYSLQPASNAGGHKCARCGSNVPDGFDFCPVCGLDQRHRFARPATQIVRIDAEPGASGAQYPVPVPTPIPTPPPGGIASPPGMSGTPPSGIGLGPAPVPTPAGPDPQGVASPGYPPAPAAVPAPAAGPAPAAVAAPQPPPTPAKTGRTVFMDGPPLPRPPEPGEEDKTIPAPGGARVEAGMPAGSGTPTPIPADVGPDGTPGRSGTVRGEGGPPGGQAPATPSMLPPDMEDIATSVEQTGADAVGPRLVLVGRDGEEGDAFAMRGASMSIGRQHGDIVFADDMFMSPQHARVERSGEVHTLVDLGSSNGVYLRIRGNSAVYPGDLFMVGHQVLRLENVSDPVAEQGPAPDGTRSFGTPLKPAWGKLALVGRGGVAGDTFFLRGAKVIFGREQGDILFPHDPFVSREHARLRLELHGAQMSVFLEDLGSANGTYIRIRGSSEIRGRDTFRVGDQILRLRLDD